MPTRTIRFKLIVPRGSQAEAVRARRALWATHEFVNQAAEHYEKLLLEMRQRDVLVAGPDGTESVESAAVWTRRLCDRLRNLGHPDDLIQQSLPRFRSLYEAMVKSSVAPNKGSAQDGRTYHSALVDPQSNAGQSRRRKIELFEPIIGRLNEPPSDLEDVAKGIIEQHAAVLLTATGSPPSWVRLYRLNDPGWLAALRAYLQSEAKAREHQSGDPLLWLQENRLLPIVEPFSRGRLRDSQKLTAFERMALALAIGHLNPWESWRHRTEAQYASRVSKVKEWEDRYAGPLEGFLCRLRAFEAERSEELARDSFWAPGSVYRLRPRELRGWRELREWLRNHPAAGATARSQKVKDLQTRMGRDFGSERVLQWLARPENQDFADHPEDPAARIAIYNGYQRLVEKSRPHRRRTGRTSRMRPAKPPGSHLGAPGRRTVHQRAARYG